jgi:hypothetical protein
MMQWLALIFAIQAGTFTGQATIEAPNQTNMVWSVPENSFYIDLEAGAEFFDIFRISGTMKSYQIADANSYFDPYRIDYGFNAYIKLKGFSFGFKHECDHPVDFSGMDGKTMKFWNATSEIYARYEVRLNPFN